MSTLEIPFKAGTYVVEPDVTNSNYLFSQEDVASIAHEGSA